MEKRTRPRQVKFWVTEKELENINKRVKDSKLTKQEYLLRSALNKKITVIPGLKEILIELSREGNNLNKLANSLNKNGQATVKDFEIIQKRLMELYSLINDTLKEGRGDE